MQMQIQYGASCILSLVVGQSTRCHPRHSPRAIFVGLLAPRCQCASLFLASAPCSALARASPLFGGRTESSPQRRPPPRSCTSFRFGSVRLYLFASVRASVYPAFGVRPRTTPLHVSSISFVVSLPLFDSRTAKVRRRSSVGLAALAKMPVGAKSLVLAPEPARVRAGSTHPCAHEITPSKIQIKCACIRPPFPFSRFVLSFLPLQAQRDTSLLSHPRHAVISRLRRWLFFLSSPLRSVSFRA